MPDQLQTPDLEVSVIIPLKDEEGSIEPLIEEIHAAFSVLNRTYEVILVDDGSIDGTWKVVQALAQADPRVSGVRFRRNFGQTAAMSAGFDCSRGTIIIPMDGDGQNDPADIPRLLEKLEQGCDVVSGWRRQRQDAALTRKLPSAVANRLISLVSGVNLHDYGCTLKAYRRDVVSDVRLYGEMHRFTPIYAVWQGASTAEIEVNHRSRREGRSKYGLMRTFKVILDLIVVKFLTDYLHKPIYVFGGLGLLCFFGAAISGSMALWLKFAGMKTLVETPLPLLTVMLFVLGTFAILGGLLAEISIRTYFEAQKKTTYAVKETTANHKSQ